MAGPSDREAADGAGGDRKPPLPRPISSARGSATPQARPSNSTHSLLPRSTPTPRGGAPRMVFRPVRPPRRNIEIKPDPDGPASTGSLLSSASTVGPSSRQGPPQRRARPLVQMTASGPFSLGSGATRVKDAGKARGLASMGISPGQSSFMTGTSGKTESTSRHDYREPDKADRLERAEYSDDEEDGFEIIDMEDVGRLDALAPVSLPRMKAKDKKKKKSNEDAVRVKRETSAIRKDGEDIEDGSIELESTNKDETAKSADALDLSASEDEEVMDNLIDDFVGDEDDSPENRLYLFQFPPLFPSFKLPKEAPAPAVKRRSVAFADDTVGGGGVAGALPSPSSETLKREDDESKSSATDPFARPEGQIGRLDVFRDGRVVFRFDDIIMDVTGGSQASFLQQVMILDDNTQKAITLGELHRKFVVAPEIESMLNDVQRSTSSIELDD